jgi:NAD(P)-dependent dehydrogenase (short-subunit alcohol dehydrogenase family)
MGEPHWSPDRRAGLGRAIALKLAAEGAKVALNYRTGEAQAREVAEEIGSRGGTSLIIRADVSVKEEARAMVARVIDLIGAADHCSSECAGGVGSGSPWLQDASFSWLPTRAAGSSADASTARTRRRVPLGTFMGPANRAARRAF